jgi:hypothetical protein
MFYQKVFQSDNSSLIRMKAPGLCKCAKLAIIERPGFAENPHAPSWCTANSKTLSAKQRHQS